MYPNENCHRSIYLIRKGQSVHIITDIDMQRVILVNFAQIINDSDETCRAGLRNSIIYHNNVIRRKQFLFSQSRRVILYLILNSVHRFDYK